MDILGDFMKRRMTNLVDKKTMSLIVIFILIVMMVSISACKKKTNENDIVISEDVVNATTADENVDVNAEASTEDVPLTEADEATDEDALSEVENMEIMIDEQVISDADVDSQTLSEIIKMVDYAYYNYLWEPSTELETIKQVDMQKFAISYIYQYEYNELFFDTNNFVLYIPDATVKTIVKLFFDTTFVIHDIDSDIVAHEDGNYLMPAMDNGQRYKPMITKIIKVSDFEYKVIFKSTDTNIGVDEPKVSYSIILDEREGRFIYSSYKMIIEESTSGGDQNLDGNDEGNSGTDSIDGVDVETDASF